jgi:predicted Rossmann-fold nucleotide-binding protein
MSYKIGVYGSNRVESEHALKMAQALGRELAQKDIIVITGACSGMPYAVAAAAKQEGAEVWGFTPELDVENQQRAYPNDDITTYSKLFYVPQNYTSLFFKEYPLPPAQDFGARLKYRNVVSTVNADAGIIITGGWGTLNEFTNLIYDGKPIGVLTGTGGLADELPAWFPRLRKKSESKVIFSSDPREIVLELLSELERKNSD